MPFLPNNKAGQIFWICWPFLPILMALTAAGQHNCQTTKHAAHGAAKGGGLALWPWDILHQRVTLDLTQGNLISGQCEISATPREAGLATLPEISSYSCISVLMAL